MNRKHTNNKQLNVILCCRLQQD